MVTKKFENMVQPHEAWLDILVMFSCGTTRKRGSPDYAPSASEMFSMEPIAITSNGRYTPSLAWMMMEAVARVYRGGQECDLEWVTRYFSLSLFYPNRTGIFCGEAGAPNLPELFFIFFLFFQVSISVPRCEHFPFILMLR